MSVDLAANGAFLRAYLAHLDPFLAREDVTDIYINRPGELWLETVDRPPELIAVPALDAPTLERLARQVAGRSARGISRRHPLLAATLPDGARIQIVAPPATREGMAIAIRRHAARALRLEDCAAGGAFAGTEVAATHVDQRAIERLVALRDGGDLPGFLAEAVRARRTILISGGTATGKTTFLNALLAEIPDHERIIAIEDTPEVALTQPNAVGLIANRGGHDEAAIAAEDLLLAALRMRPDRIIMGELRGREAFSFLRAVNTGHPGSITTIHADSPKGAIDQLALMVLEAGTTLTRADVEHYVRSTVHIVIQLARIDGRRVVQAVSGA